MKRFFALVAVLTLTAMLMVGCGGEKKEAAPSNDKSNVKATVPYEIHSVKEDMNTSLSTTQVAPAGDQVQDKKEITVCVTRTGKKYHRDGCRYLAKSKIPMSLSDAKAAGYEPCSVCNPPR